jgi:brefeldin A-resistance guanine nucleotide exchange factor 1
MFRLVWGPMVHALCACVDNVGHEALVNQALDGLMVRHMALPQDDDVA